MSSKRSWKVFVGLLGVMGYLTASCTGDSEGADVDFPPGSGDAGEDVTEADQGVGGSGGTGGTGTGGTATGGTAGAATGGTAGAATGGTAGAATGGTAGAATGGTAGAATGGTAGAATGGTAGTGAVESSCLDGVDNDGDGLVDCADPDCSPDHQCVAAPPTGWEGFFWYRSEPWSTTPSDPEPCPDASPPTRFFEDAGDPFDCSCSCGNLQGASCLPAPIGCTNANTTCSNLSDWTSQLAGGTCQKPGSGNTLSCRLTGPAPVDQPGSCQATSTKQEKDPFGGITDVCGAPLAGGGGCGSGVCVPKTAAPYDSGACIRKSGIVACPTGWSDEHDLFEDGDDQRTCTECSCAPDVASISCEGTVYTGYDYNNCTGGTRTVSSTSCQNISAVADLQTWSLRLTTKPTPSGGQCTVVGGTPAGSVVTTGDATYCCLP
jgi:hypothetical protein